MYAFYCEDLDTNLYITEIVNQPFNNDYSAYNPLEAPVSFDPWERHRADIIAAHNNHVVWYTRIYKLGFMYYNGAVSTSSFGTSAVYNPDTDKITISVGSIVASDPNRYAHYTTTTVDFSDWYNNPAKGYLYLFEKKHRDLMDTPPAYSGEKTLYLVAGYCQSRKGTFDPTPSGIYTHGVWTYLTDEVTSYRNIPTCIPCQTNGASVANCNTTVGSMITTEAWHTTYTDLKITDSTGTVDPDPDPPTTDEPFDPSTPDPYTPSGGDGDTSDLIEIPTNPNIGITNAGFINVYNPALNSLQGLGDILFPNVASATDVQDAIIKVCEALQNSNLINYVIDCHVIPVTPQTGTNANIKVGFRDTGISVPVVTSDYVDATCGSISLPEYFSGFQDYLCTRSKLYLPFVGFVDTKPEYWQAGTISVDYKFNVIDGSFMCYVRSVSSKSKLNGSVIAQYSGNACMHFPLTGNNYSNMVSGIIGGVVTMATAGTSSAILGGAMSALNSFSQGPDVQQSNGYNSTACLMGVREAFLLIERPKPSYPAKYAHDKGYPSNITTQLSNISGFTVIEDIDLSGIPMTEAEIEELRGLLKEGVYF